MTAKATPVLSVGAVLGDSDKLNMSWSRTIGGLSQRVDALSSGLTSPLNVNVIFHVDGKLSPNEFTGVRTGRFSKARALLVVQAAVPPGPPDGAPEVILLRLLGDAVAAAEEFGRQRRIARDLAEIRGLVANLGPGSDSQ